MQIHKLQINEKQNPKIVELKRAYEIHAAIVYSISGEYRLWLAHFST